MGDRKRGDARPPERQLIRGPSRRDSQSERRPGVLIPPPGGRQGVPDVALVAATAVGGERLVEPPHHAETFPPFCIALALTSPQGGVLSAASSPRGSPRPQGRDEGVTIPFFSALRPLRCLRVHLCGAARRTRTPGSPRGAACAALP